MEEPCYTLAQLEEEITRQNTGKLILNFLPGEYYFSQQLSINNINNVELARYVPDSEVWLYNARVRISDVQDLTITSLSFISHRNRGSVVAIGVSQSGNILLTDCTFVESMIVFSNSNSITIVQCIFNSSRLMESDISIVRVLTTTSYVNITNCEFVDNKYYRSDIPTVDVRNTDFLYINHCTFASSHARASGGIRIRARDVTSGVTHITNCMFIAMHANFENGGVVNIVRATMVTVIENSTFRNNSVVNGGIINAQESTQLKIIKSTFTNNYGDASVVNVVYANYLYIIDCEYIDNINTDSIPTVVVEVDYETRVYNSTFISNLGGGISVFALYGGFVNITNCDFTNNSGIVDSGGISVVKAIGITIQDCTFTNNTAELGGAIKIYTDWSNHLNIISCTFTGNYVPNEWAGSAIFIRESYTTVQDTVLYSNSGADVLTIIQGTLNIQNTSITHNYATNYRVVTTLQSSLTLKQVTFNNNRGYIYPFNSRVNIMGPVTLSGNTGGAIRAIQSQIFIYQREKIIIHNNTAGSGGGILLRGSELVVRSPLILSNNKAQMFGGAIYAYQSVIDFNYEQRIEKSIIIGNFAGQNGGGICAVASTIKLLNFHVSISSNTALISGGGLFLQENSKLFLLKQEEERRKPNVWLNLTYNYAGYGGGIFVADNSTAGGPQCRGKESVKDDDASVSPDCFIQTFRFYQQTENTNINIINTFIFNNTAESGSALYGGLLDRCTVSTLAEAHDKKLSGLQYIKMTVLGLTDSSITSDPLQVVFCNQLNQEVIYHGNHSIIYARKGEAFKINVSAIDQVGHQLYATIYSSVVTESRIGRLKEGQAEQKVGGQCTELEYNVFSHDSSAQVQLYANGPCTNLGVSRQTFSVAFLPCTCPIGFQPSLSQIKCDCICDQVLRPYQITNCSQETGTILLETNLWIGVANYLNQTKYIIHDCPFDYCVEKPANISLNSSQKRDRQCAFNRSGMLCGECKGNLSLVLATSKCKKCSNIYLLLLVPFALAGIALVGFILFFNLTVATGTIHGLIFYSNLLPGIYFTHPNALTVFISWVNLDFGIETCFYNGLDSQAKVLLQLVFPAYLFLLVFLIIILCRYINFFATLLSYRNPVAALSTLIFLSYSKLLRFIIAALQSTVLDFPGGSKQRVWLYDANVTYFSSSQTPRFLVAILILIAGGLFTLQLLFAQWYPYCSKQKAIVKLTRNTKYIGFMDTYHAPFSRKHRYWLGLLLLALIVHNVIAAMAADDFLPVLSMGCIAICLIILKFICKRVYKSWVNDLLETFFLLNLILLTYATLYTRTPETKYPVSTLANVSIGFSACSFFTIVCYHSYKYVYLQSRFYRKHKKKIKNMFSRVGKRLRKAQEMNELATDQQDTHETHYTAMTTHQQRELDLDVLAPITTDDYTSVSSKSCKGQPKVTCTVIDKIQ